MLFNDFQCVYVLSQSFLVSDKSRGWPEGSLFNRGGHYSFPRIAPLYPWYVPYIAECKARRYQEPFSKSLVWRDRRLNPGLPDLKRTLYPLDQWWVIFGKNWNKVMYTFQRIEIGTIKIKKKKSFSFISKFVVIFSFFEATRYPPTTSNFETA